ncbi:MAG: HepT-like ribonuclease domain-containing protein [Nitrospiraceae bacterium]
MIDPTLVTRKMSLILQALPRLSKLADLPRDSYMNDPTHETLAERYLERTIGRMIDINFHLATEFEHGVPKDYYDSFVVLGSLGVMPHEMAKECAKAAGLRNPIVHEYDEIDAARVYEALAVAVRQIPQYLEAIQRFLDRNRPA